MDRPVTRSPSRRAFLAGFAAASLCPRPSWADAGAPAYLAAAAFPDGGYRLAGIGADGAVIFTRALPGRGHAAAAHPARPEAVAFARRPGVFALVIDCRTGHENAVMQAPEGRHFYGHGTFSEDGTRLFTAENDYEAGRGIIGVWDAQAGYRRLGEFSAGGVGPHDLRLMPGGRMLVVANGGIETHPDAGRAKLNIPTMRPNLSYIDLSGRLHEQIALPHAMHKNSIRHLAVHGDGQVAFAMQWQGDIHNAPPLLGLHRRGEAPRLLSAPDPAHQRLRGYAGSVAFSGDGRQVGITSPRGGMVQIFDVTQGMLAKSHDVADVCGLAPGTHGTSSFIYTAGTGEIGRLQDGDARALQRTRPQWDNHLVAL